MLMSLLKKIEKIRFSITHTSLSSLSSIIIKGDDSKQFLNRQLTSNISILQDGNFQQSAVLDIKGRIISSFILMQLNAKEFVLLVEKDFLDQTLERLNLYLVSEDVEFETSTDCYFANWGIIKDDLMGFRGKLYNDMCIISKIHSKKSYELSREELDLFRFCSGEVELGKEAIPGELMTNTFLIETALAVNKGCYPGQETVSKIMNNRGAHFYPVCLISKSDLIETTIEVNGNKIGDIKAKIKLDEYFYYYVLLNRENRVKNKIIKIIDSEFVVNTFPLVDNSTQEKSEYLFMQAIDEFQKNNENKAIELLELAIEFDPKYEDAYESLGVIYGRVGDNHRAIELMHKLLKLNPLSVMGHTNLSLYYMKIGDKDQAEEHKSLATVTQFEVFGVEAQSKRNLESETKRKQEEQVRRVGMFKQVLEIDSEDALANFGMGEVELELGDFLSAQRYLQQAIVSDAKYSVAYLALAKAYQAGKKLEELKEVLELGISVSTKNGDMMPANEMQSMLNKLS